MPLTRFAVCLEAVDQVTAADRQDFVIDMSTVVSSIFAKKGTNPVGKHVDLLASAARGEHGKDQ